MASATSVPLPPVPTAASALGRPRLRWALLIAVAVFVVFGRTVGFGFVMFDDEAHIRDDPYLRPFTAHSLAAFWGKPYLGLYIPATYTGWGLLSLVAATPRQGGTTTLDPAVFHLANVVLHAANAVLVWLILRRLIAAEAPAIVGALAFALHPVQAEPVAWASGFKDTFSGLWALLSILLFLRAHRRATWGAYGLATAAYAVALCAKPASVVVPPIAGLLAWAAGGRVTRRSLGALAGWVALGLLCSWVTHRQQADATVMTWNPPAVRPLVAADAIAFYARHLVWPAGLAIDYGRTPRWVWDHVTGAALGITAAVVAGVGLVGVARRLGDRRIVPAGVAVFIVGVGPVLGIVPFIYQQFSTVSDRYLYLPMLGVAVVVAWAAKVAGPLARPVAGAVLLIWAGVTATQVGVWRDTFSLFEHNLTVNPRSGIAWSTLALAAERAGDLSASERDSRTAIALDPDEPKYEVTLARVLAREPGRSAEARQHYALSLAAAARRVLRVDPGSPLAHRSLAQAYEQLGRAADAAAEQALADRLRAAGHVDMKMPEAHW